MDLLHQLTMGKSNEITHENKKQSVWRYRIGAWQLRATKISKNTFPFKNSSLVFISFLVLQSNKPLLCLNITKRIAKVLTTPELSNLATLTP